MSRAKCILSRKKHHLLTLLLFFLCAGFCLQISARPVSAAVTTVTGGAFEKAGNYWVYRKTDKTLVKDGMYKINGQYYYFSSKGYRYSGWHKIGNTYYYFGTPDEGFMYRNRWLTYANSVYFMKSTGKRATGWLTVKKKVYYFNAKGQRQYGWQKIGGKQYYLGKEDEGYRYTSTFVTLDGKTYYLQKDGVMATGWLKINGVNYYFNSDGSAVTGRKKVGSVTYNFDSKGGVISQGANLTLSSPSAILVEASTGKILYAKNSDTKFSSAPATKILTAVLALEKKSLTAEITASKKAASQQPTTLGMKKGETFYLKDLIYSILVASHNDAAVAIAEGVSGTQTKFVSLMNRKAKSIGCQKTKFKTVTGLTNNSKHYTTASDLSKIAMYAWKNENFRQMVGTPSYTFQSLDGNSYKLSNINKLLGKNGTLGIKSSYTAWDQNCFIGAVQGKNGKTYISVVLGASTSNKRWKDSKKLLNYAYKLS